MTDATIEVDVLVVGGGGGGLRAAIEAQDAGARVLVLSKGIVGKSGLTQTAVTGFQVAFGCADPRDNPAVHFADPIRGSYGLANPELVDIFSREGAATVEDIESFGARFDRDDDGKFIQRRLDSSQTYPRSIKKGDSLGTPIMQALRRQMNKCKVPRRHEILVTKLLTDGDHISGAVAIDFQTGELLEIRARSVIMATGGGGELFPVNSNTPDSTGDGCALALGAGADLVDMEFILMLGHAVMFPETVRGVLFTFQYLLEKGARALFNAEGEPFLSRYDPEGSDNPPRHIYARAIYGEVRAGRGSPHGGVFFDPGSVPLQTVVDALPSQTRLLQSFGVDMRQPIEVGVAAHYFCGGIKIGPDSQSNVPSLYGVGECSGGPHGAARVGGNSLTEVLVFGKRAGRHAAKSAAAAQPTINNQEEVETECRRLLGFLDGSRNGPRPGEIKRRLKKTMNDHVGVVRDAAGLKGALDAFEEITMRDLPAMALASPERVANYDWIQAIEATVMTRVGEAVARAALMRTESRGAHYRQDHPDQIDEAWLRNIVVRERGGELAVSSIPVNNTARRHEAG